MAQVAKTPSPVTPVQEPTQESRAAAIWHAFQNLDALETKVEADLVKLIATERAAAVALETAKKARQDAQERHPLMQQIREAQEGLSILKAQFLTSYQPGEPKTVETGDGNKVQVRSKTVCHITDGKKVAQTLLEKDLWDAAGVTITANDDMMAMMVKNKVLQDAVTIENKLSIALIAKKE